MSKNEMLSKKKWAVIGVTEDKNKFGYKIYKKLKDSGYDVYPISIKNKEIYGDKAYTSLLELPVKVEVVDFVVNPKVGVSIVEQCKELGIKNIWLQPGTVSEELIQKAENNMINYHKGCVLVEL